jgi:hypothetical protein
MDKVYNPETKIEVQNANKRLNKLVSMRNKLDLMINEVELILKNLEYTKRKINKKESSNNKKEAINKIKKAFSPFINRISGDIYIRNRYLIMMRRELNKVLKEGKGCLKIYKENPDGTFKYRIGSHIILNKRIGNDSTFGEAYLSEFREKSKKLLTFVSKIYELNSKTNQELEILELLTNKVRMGICPHFPITYGYIKCEKLNGSDSFKKSNSKNLSVEQDLKNYPKIYQNIIDNNSTLITLFNELANGDLKSFFTDYQGHTEKILNSLIQILLSIVYFYYHINKTHNDCHWGNFLYHKIKKGGYFHYKIFDEDFYLENLGFLWVIWDFDFTKSIKDEIEMKDNYCFADFDKIILFYLPNYKLYPTQFITGTNTIKFKEDMTDFFEIIYLFYKDFILYQDRLFEYSNLMNFIKGLIKYFKDNHWLLTKIPSGSNVINKEPYVIGKDFLSRY